MFNLLIMNLIVLSTAFLLVRYYFYFESAADYVITFSLIYFTQIVLTLQLLGALRQLYLNNIIFLNLFILLAVFLIIKAGRRKPLDDFREKMRYFLGSLSLNWIERLLCSAILGFTLVKIAINLVNPPFGWDNLNYHFTFPVEWLKHGNLDNPISISGDPGVSYYPINASLFFLWFILPLKNVFIADLGQIPFFLIAFLAVYALAKKMSISREYSFFSAALFTLIPNYFKQTKIAYVDVMVAALLLVALNYLLLLYKEKSLKNSLLFSIALGLVLGTKTTAIPLAMLLLIPFSRFCFTKVKIKKSLFFLITAVSFIVAIGGFGYIRNFIQTNNPFYPLNFKLFNRVIFKGVVDNQIYRTGIRPGDFSLVKILFSEGLGAQTILFILPAIVLGLPIAFIKRRRELNFNLVYFLILPLLFILVFRFVIPLANLRYIYAMFAISLVIAFYAAETLRLPKTLIKTLIIICLFASLAELGKRTELVASFIFFFIFLFTSPYLIRFIKSKNLIKYSIFIFVIIFSALVVLEKDYIKNEFPRYVKTVKYSGFWPDAAKAWVWLNENTSGNNIAHVGRPVPFPLYGTNFKNNVYYVSVNKTEPAKLHYFKDAKYVSGYHGKIPFRNFEDDKNYRGGADYVVWLSNLLKKNTDYLFIYSQLLGKADDFPLEDGWAGSHPEVFELAFKNGTIHIYKIKK